MRTAVIAVLGLCGLGDLCRLAHGDPAPPAQIAELAKQRAGTQTCTGKIFLPSGTLALTATITTKLDGFWLRDHFDGRAGKQRFVYDGYTTFDPTARVWRRVLVDNLGGYMTGSAAAPTDFALDGVGPTGTLAYRDHGTWGERSTDQGKTWTRDYELTCKR